MNTAFCGTTAFASSVLESLVGGEFSPSLIIAPPPSRAGRGRTLTPAPVADFAREAEIPLLEADDVNSGDALRALGEVSPGAVVVCAFGQLIGPELVAAHRFLNIHPSLVPRWRGAAPIERALLAGDPVTGVSVMDLTTGLDDGPVLGREEVRIEPADTYETLSRRLEESACSVVAEVLAEIQSGSDDPEPQDDALATYAEKIDPAERRLSPASSAVDLDRRVRALGGRLGTYLQFGERSDQRLGVTACTPSDSLPDGVIGGETGCLVSDGETLWLICQEGVLGLDQVKPAGGKAVSSGDYLRGHEPPERAL